MGDGFEGEELPPGFGDEIDDVAAGENGSGGDDGGEEDAGDGFCGGVAEDGGASGYVYKALLGKGEKSRCLFFGGLRRGVEREAE